MSEKIQQFRKCQHSGHANVKWYLCHSTFRFILPTQHEQCCTEYGSKQFITGKERNHKHQHYLHQQTVDRINFIAMLEIDSIIIGKRGRIRQQLKSFTKLKVLSITCSYIYMYYYLSTYILSIHTHIEAKIHFKKFLKASLLRCKYAPKVLYVYTLYIY